MKLRRIALDGFRNYTDFTADFSPGVNVIWGENAQGKTNLLEAIGFLSGARSHRARGDKELLSFHGDLRRWLLQNGMDANINSGITMEQGGNRTVAELKQERERLREQHTTTHEHEF